MKARELFTIEYMDEVQGFAHIELYVNPLEVIFEGNSIKLEGVMSAKSMHGILKLEEVYNHVQTNDLQVIVNYMDKNYNCKFDDLKYKQFTKLLYKYNIELSF